MNKERDELKAAMEALAEKQQRLSGAHATPEEVIAYHSRELPAQEAERLREHLVWCRECLGLLQDWAAFDELAQEGQRRRSPAQMTAAWQAMQARLNLSDQRSAISDQEALDTEQRTTDHGPRTTWLGWLVGPARIPYAAAASLLIVTLGLGAWNISLRRESRQQIARLDEQLTERNRALAALTQSLEETRRQLETAARPPEQLEAEIAKLRQTVDELSQPQINGLIVDLDPQQTVREQEPVTKLEPITVPSGTNAFTVIVDQRGNLVWRRDGLRPSREENFPLILLRRSLPAGQYRLRLYGVQAGRRQQVEEYAVRIQYQ
jgi:hypothetical protein